MLQVGCLITLATALIRAMRAHDAWRIARSRWLPQYKVLQLPYITTITNETPGSSSEVLFEQPPDTSIDWSTVSFITADSSYVRPGGGIRQSLAHIGISMANIEAAQTEVQEPATLGQSSSKLRRTSSVPHGLERLPPPLLPTTTGRSSWKLEVTASRCFSTSGETVDGSEIQERARQSLAALNLEVLGKRVTPMALLRAPPDVQV